MTEILPVNAYEQFIAALTDAAMTVPGGGAPLFDPAQISIQEGNEGSINNSNGTFTLPLQQAYIFVSIDYGPEVSYTDSDTYRDVCVTIPFCVLTNTQRDQRNIKKLLEFARLSRRAVFSKYGLVQISGSIRRRQLAYSSPLGLVGVQYTWEFWFGDSSVQ